MMEMIVATLDDMHELLELQRRAYAPAFGSLDWTDESPLDETLEHLCQEFRRCTIYKVQNAEGQIIGSIRGNVADGSLWMGRMMVHPDYQGQGIGRFMFYEIQRLMPHRQAWFWACLQMSATYNFYLRQGFKPTGILNENPKLTWIYMEKK